MSAEESRQIEGLWEEVVAQSSELAGRRVRVTVLPDAAPPTLAEMARRWAQECERLLPQPVPEAVGIKGEITRLLAVKFRRQGIVS